LRANKNFNFPWKSIDDLHHADVLITIPNYPRPMTEAQEAEVAYAKDNVSRLVCKYVMDFLSYAELSYIR